MEVSAFPTAVTSPPIGIRPTGPNLLTWPQVLKRQPLVGSLAFDITLAHHEQDHSEQRWKAICLALARLARGDALLFASAVDHLRQRWEAAP